MHADRKSPKGWWVLASLFPFGLGTWAGFAYAGSQTGTRRWQVYAALYALAAVVALTYSTATHVDDADNGFAGALIMLPWVFGIGTRSSPGQPTFARSLAARVRSRRPRSGSPSATRR